MIKTIRVSMVITSLLASALLNFPVLAEDVPVTTTAPAVSQAAPASAAENPAQVNAPLAELKESIKRCTKIQESFIRLTCYNSLAATLGFISDEEVKAEEKKLGQTGFWQASEREDSDGNKQTYLRVESTETLKSRSATERRVVLALRCIPGQTDVFLDWKAPLVEKLEVNPRRIKDGENKIQVIYKIDQEPKITEGWDPSIDKLALFSPDSVSFVRNIMNKKKLVMEITPDGEATQRVRFEIAGIEKAIDTIVKACY